MAKVGGMPPGTRLALTAPLATTRLLLLIAEHLPHALSEDKPEEEWEAMLQQSDTADGSIEPLLSQLPRDERTVQFIMSLRSNLNKTMKGPLDFTAENAMKGFKTSNYEAFNLTNPLEGVALNYHVVERLCSRLNMNACGITEVAFPVPVTSGIALYGRISFMNHSCVPNITLTHAGRRGQVRATKELTPGEEIMYQYTASEGTSATSRLFLQKYMFACRCERCSAVDSAVARIRRGECPGTPIHEDDSPPPTCHGAIPQQDDWKWWGREVALGGMKCPMPGCTDMCIPWLPLRCGEFPGVHYRTKAHDCTPRPAEPLFGRRQWVCGTCGILPFAKRVTLDNWWERAERIVQAVIQQYPNPPKFRQYVWWSLTKQIPATHELLFPLARDSEMRREHPAQHVFWCEREFATYDVTWGITAAQPWSRVNADVAAFMFRYVAETVADIQPIKAVELLRRTLCWIDLCFGKDTTEKDAIFAKEHSAQLLAIASRRHAGNIRL